MPDPLIAFDGVTLGYGGVPVLRDLTFTVAAGDFLAFVGPNGAGKTTVLRAIAGLLRPLRGIVFRRRVGALGYVPQERELDPVFPLSAMDVVLQGRIACLGAWRRPGTGDLEIAHRAMLQADVASLAETSFHALSGGQKQRVLIARALAAEPVLMIFDEPTSGMDPTAERALMDLLLRLHREHGLVIVLATHNLGIVANYARHVAIVDGTRQLFHLGTDQEILTDDMLTRLDGGRMRVRRIEGWRAIIPGGAAC